MKTLGVLDYEMNNMLDILLLTDRHVQLDREIEKQTLRETEQMGMQDRQTYRQSPRQTDTHTHRQTGNFFYT